MPWRDRQMQHNICTYSNSISMEADDREDTSMPRFAISKKEFLDDRQGRTFADVVNDPDCPFDEVLTFFSDKSRQQRMEDSEIHHDRAPLAGVVREFESHPAINRFLAAVHTKRTNRFRQAVGVLVRIIMQRRGWRKTGRKGSLGVRASMAKQTPAHNTGGLAFWFIRAERYEQGDGMPFQSVRERCAELDSTKANPTTARK